VKIDCLMGTYARNSVAREALACFLQQSVSADATLLIYNQHAAPLHCDHPRVRVVNETSPAAPLRFVRQRMLELADPSADFIHWWDDDDLYLPWHLQDCLDHVGDCPAWKPQSSWVSWNNVEFVREVNQFEGSWIFRAEHLRAAPLDTHPTYTDHPVFYQTEEAGFLATTELAGLTSYIYRRAIGVQHLSGYGYGGSESAQRAYIQLWRARSQDAPPSGLLEPADLTLRWRQYLAGIGHLVTDDEGTTIRERLGLRTEATPKGGEAPVKSETLVDRAAPARS
jgi:hypothetical protein